MGVVPSVDTIENDTPNAIINSPITKEPALLAVKSSPPNCMVYYIFKIIFKEFVKTKNYIKQFTNMFNNSIEKIEYLPNIKNV